jgi:hypothetical protein
MRSVANVVVMFAGFLGFAAVACSGPTAQSEEQKKGGSAAISGSSGGADDVPPPPADPLGGGFNLPPNEPPPAGQAAGGGNVFFAIDASGVKLLRFEEKAAATVTAKAITGLSSANEKILAIDFRPKDKKLFALGSTSRLYTLDGATGQATAVGPELIVPLSGSAFGFDFDPEADVVRVASDKDQNIAIDPTTGFVANDDVPFSFAEGDVNAAKSPTLVASAFAKTGKYFAIDGALRILTVTSDPYSGVVETVGSLGTGFSATAKVGGLNVATNGTAYAAIAEQADGTALYTIDLATGKASKVAKIGSEDSAIVSLAIQP